MTLDGFWRCEITTEKTQTFIQRGATLYKCYTISLCLLGSDNFLIIMCLFADKPHNPLINAGAIVTASLIKGNLRLADRFDYVSTLVTYIIPVNTKHL